MPEGIRWVSFKKLSRLSALVKSLPPLPTGKFAVVANMDGVMPGYEASPWVILAVDYSFHGFSLGLYNVEQAGLVDAIKEEYYPYLGSDRSAQKEDPGYLETLKKSASSSHQ
jgi:hypothetical protein